MAWLHAWWLLAMLCLPMPGMLLVGVEPAGAGDPEPPEVTGTQRLTLEQTMGRGDRVSFRPSLPRVRWARDGKHLVQSEGRESLWIDPSTLEEAEPVPRERRGDRPASLQEAFEKLPGFDGDDAERAARGSVGSAGGRRLVRFENDLYSVDNQGDVTRLTDDPTREQEPSLSPDGNFAAFVSDSDLHVVATRSGRVRRVTRDGSETVFNGRLDWVYQEEVYGRGRYRGYWWSPDSRNVAFLRLDESEVPVFTVVDHIPMNGRAEQTRYPKAGAPNPGVGLGVASVRGGAVRWLDLSHLGSPEEILVVRVDWSPDGDRVIFMVQDRIQTWLELCEANPRNGRVKTLIREQSSSWVNRAAAPRWLDDGSFLWLSDRTGYRHIYHYRKDGELVRALTAGEWPVGRITRVDEERGLVDFSASPDSAVDSHQFRVPLKGGEPRRLTRDRGSHRVSMRADGAYFIDQVSSVSMPPEIRLCRAEDGEILRTWRGDIDALKEYAYRPAELLQIPARDGFVLDAMLIRPPDFDPERRYGVWLPTYSGPNSPSVRNGWQTSGWDQFLAQQGYLVFRVNVRSASGRGQATTATCYKQLGVQELRDLEDAVSWLVAHPWADEGRVGITGWSYGGFMAAYAATHSKMFSLAVAGAGVYDWRCYDSIYTERYMSTPQLNPEGYEASSCTAAADQLHGHLVILHGMIDDNVHAQNAFQFILALQKAEKPFELMLYPESRHGIRHSGQRWSRRQLTWNAIRKHLGVRL